MKDDIECEDHSAKFGGIMHPDHPKKSDTEHKHLHSDHSRAAAPPAHHTKGAMPSQLNPDMGPHHHKRR